MILDSGICTVYRKYNTAGPGAMPVWADRPIHTSWYGELRFDTRPAWTTNAREEVRCDARIRILQNRQIANHDRVELQGRDGTSTMYEVVRCYHGTDDESGEAISDISLEVTEP